MIWLRERVGEGYALSIRMIDLLEKYLTPLFALGLRIYLSEIFLRSGLLKLADWSNTLSLFDYVYMVPVLPAHLAAVLGTMGEVGLPILLILGLATRFSAAGIFVLNYVAAVSFSDLSDLGLQDHILWGTIGLVIVFYGPSTLSIDHWLHRKMRSSKPSPTS